MTGNVANDPILVGKLVRLFRDTPTANLITNLTAQIDSYTLGNRTFPISRSEGQNCYICSPTVAYIDYAIEETRNFARNPWLRGILLALIRACRPLIRSTGLDRQVQPNNWLFSTNPVPAMSAQDAARMRDGLSQSDPDRAIVIRSLNPAADMDSIAALQHAGFVMLPARQIYVFAAHQDKRPTADARRDRNLLNKSRYQISPASTFSVQDYSRAAELYQMLYLNKYTPLNPQYTASYLAHAHRIGLLKISGLRNEDGQLDGMVGLFEAGDTLTMPIVGYDTGKPQKFGLYRMLNAIGHSHAVAHGMLYNMSAGAAAFKRYRGAEPTIEYTAAYVAHLGWRARLATRITKTVLDVIGVPILRKFGL